MIPSQEVYDFTVPATGNYISVGVVHHNTYSAGAETAYHLTGRYPDWWQGKRFKKPTTGWAASVTNQGTRDTVQRILLGQPGSWGTGSIPKDQIAEIKRSTHGVADAVDTMLVKHISGGVSRLGFKSYDQGRERFQGESLDFGWADEEPPEDVYKEFATRTNATKGIMYLTFTPLKGYSEVVNRFLTDKAPGTHVTTMTIEDAEHFTPAERLAVIAKYKPHERDARTKGIPTLGSGRIFPLEDAAIRCAPFELPPHWPRIAGMDIGWDHPTAVTWLAWDRDTDTIYVYAMHKLREQTPVVHAASIRARGDWIPVAWPHDALQHDKGSGQEIAEQYRKQGVNMLKDKASWPDKLVRGVKVPGGNSVEAGLFDMLDRMQTGRWKVFAHLEDWFDEFRIYHREEGRVVKKMDDGISSSRYGLMMLRHAVTHASQRKELPFVMTEILDETCNY